MEAAHALMRTPSTKASRAPRQDCVALPDGNGGGPRKGRSSSSSKDVTHRYSFCALYFLKTSVTPGNSEQWFKKAIDSIYNESL